MMEEAYQAVNPYQMQEMQRIMFSHGFCGYSGKQDLWGTHMWINNMILIFSIDANGKKTWGWSSYKGNKTFNDFNKKWRYKMNEIIINAFPNTKDAVLVDKHFGRKIDDPIFALLLKGKEDDLLEEAKRLDREEKEKKN